MGVKRRKRASTGSEPCDPVECHTNGDATERRSAYAKATADKSADKYEIGGGGVARQICRASVAVRVDTRGQFLVIYAQLI